jgi:nitrogen fixation protein FixH
MLKKSAIAVVLLLLMSLPMFYVTPNSTLSQTTESPTTIIAQRAGGTNYTVSLLTNQNFTGSATGWQYEEWGNNPSYATGNYWTTDYYTSPGSVRLQLSSTSSYSLQCELGWSQYFTYTGTTPVLSAVLTFRWKCYSYTYAGSTNYMEIYMELPQGSNNWVQIWHEHFYSTTGWNFRSVDISSYLNTYKAAIYSFEADAYLTTSGSGAPNVRVEYDDVGIQVKYNVVQVPTVAATINNNNPYTNNRLVTLNLNATNGPDSMSFRNENNATWSTYENFQTTKQWRLSTGDGSKTVLVKVKNSAGESTVSNDTIIYDGSAPPAPKLQSPTNGTAINNNAPTFSWLAVTDPIVGGVASGLASYSLDYSKDINFVTGVTTVSIPSGTTSYAPSSLADGTWYWRVKAIDNAGNSGPYNGTNWFVVIDTAYPPGPTLTSPVTGSFMKTRSVTFVWNPSQDPSPSSGIASYTLQYSLDPNFVSGVTTVSGITATSSATTLGSDGTWYWRVRAIDKAGNIGSYSGSSSVIIDTVAPGQPTLSSPGNGANTNINTPTFAWSAATDPSPSSGIASYTLQLDTSSSFNNATGKMRTIKGITGTSYTAASALTDGTWYWRVNATDNAGNKGAYTSSWRLVVDTVAPGSPTLSSPGNGASTNDNTPTFTWGNATDASPSSGLASHTLQYSKDQTFATGVTTVTGLGSSYTVPSGSPLSDGTWYWRVRGVDFAGNTGSWSATNYVIIIDTVVPGAPILSSPTTGSATSNSRPTFAWSAATDPSPSSGIASYTLQIDTSSSFNSGNLRTLTGLGTSYTIPAGSPLADGTWYWRVRAVDNAGNTGSYSSYWTVAVDTVVPSSPSPSSPASGTNTNVNTPTFAWSAATDPSPSSGIASYTLQLDTSSSFNNATGKMRTITVTTGTSYTAASALTDGTWYWRVRAVDNAGNTGSYSSYWTIVIDTVAPGLPTLLSPSNGAGISVNTPTFTWSAATDATSGVASYTLQIDTSPSFNSGNLRTITGITGTSYTVTSPLADGTWYWRVRAVDNAGNTGTYTNHWSIVIDTVIPGAPTLLTPTNGLITKSNTQTFSWSNVSATTYDFYIDRSPAFNTANLTIIYGLTNLSKVFGNLVDGNWYWKVIAQRIGGSNSSTVWGFFVDTAAPNQPTLNSPSTGTNTNVNTPTFAWSAATDPSPSSGIASYTLQLDTSSSFNSGNLRTITGITGTSYTAASALTDGTWYWRVNATDKAGNTGSYSSYWTIVIDTVAPGLPTLLSPSDGASTNVNRPIFTWSAATDATSGVASYTLQIDTSSSFNSGNLRTITGITGTSYTVTSPLADGTWYWRVRAVDNAGNTGTYTTSRSFAVDTVSPGLPTLASPSTGSATSNNRPTFTWSAATDPSPSSGITYTLQIDTSTSFNSGNLRTIAGFIGTSYTIPIGSPLSDGTWYWRVNATDNAGNKGAYTGYWSLVVDTVAPGSPTLSSPANGAKTNNTLPSLVWSPATDATSGVANYTLQLDTSSSFNSGNLRTIGGLTASSYTVVSALGAGTWYWQVKAIDKAGNSGLYSGYLNFTIDTQPPTISGFSRVGGNYTNSLTITLSITATDNLGSPQKMYLSNDGSNWVEFDFASSTSWTLTAGDGVKHVYFKCKDAAGNWASLAGGFISITLDTVPPTAGSPSVPASGSVISTNMTTFQWSAGSDGSGSGIDWYGLQLDTTTSFNSPNMISRQASTGTSYTLTFALSDGTWYWRINATDRAGNKGQYSIYSMFNLNVIPPSIVTSLGPPNNYALSNKSSPRFNWGSTGAYRYHIQIDKASNFSTPYLIENDTLYSNTFSPADDNRIPLTDGTWYWRVESISIAGAHSGYSSIYQIQIITQPPDSPVLLVPTNQSATRVRDHINFAWNSVTGAVSYWLQFDRLPTFNSSDVSGYTFANLTLPSYTYTKSLFDGRWYWHVFSLDAIGNINNSELVPVYQFIIDTTSPSQPVLEFPNQGSFTNQPLPTFAWYPANDTPAGNPPVYSGIANYTLSLDTSPSFGSPNLRTIHVVTGTTYTLTSPLSDGVWYWHVSATDKAGNVGFLSFLGQFSVDTVAPAPPSPITPNNTPVDVSKVTFQWGVPYDPSGITEYMIQIDTSNGFDSPECLEYNVTGATTYTPGTELHNGQWYWRIAAVDGAGNVGAWSEAIPFTVNAVTGLSPVMMLMIGGGSSGVVVLGILGYIMYRRAKIPFVIKKIDQSIKLIGKGDMPQPVPMRTRTQVINGIFENKLAIISRQKLEEAKEKKKKSSKEAELAQQAIAPSPTPSGAKVSAKTEAEESDVELIAKELERLEDKEDKSADESELIRREIDELEKGSKKKKSESD